MPEVLNVHHFGEIEKLPSTAVYVGRGNGNIWGNRYSSKSGKFTKQECVALHRVDLYRELIADPSLFTRLKTELNDKDLACWCVHPKKVSACHAYNYLHVLAPPYVERSYDRTILSYLMEDLRAVLTALQDKLHQPEKWPAPFSSLDICGDETKCEINFLFHIVQTQQKKAREIEEKYGHENAGAPDPMRVCEYVAEIVVELELALRETEPAMIWWRLEHCAWTIRRFIYTPDVVGDEPLSPQLKLKPLSKQT